MSQHSTVTAPDQDSEAPNQYHQHHQQSTMTAPAFEFNSDWDLSADPDFTTATSASDLPWGTGSPQAQYHHDSVSIHAQQTHAFDMHPASLDAQHNWRVPGPNPVSNFVPSLHQGYDGISSCSPLADNRARLPASESYPNLAFPDSDSSTSTRVSRHYTVPYLRGNRPELGVSNFPSSSGSSHYGTYPYGHYSQIPASSPMLSSNVVSSPMGRHSSSNLRRTLARVSPYAGHDQRGRGSRPSLAISVGSGSSFQSSIATGSGSFLSQDSPHQQLEVIPAAAGPATGAQVAVANWLPENRRPVRKMANIISAAPGCHELIDETRAFFIADVLCYRRCLWDTYDKMFAIARESLSTMATRRVQYMTFKRPEQPPCLPLEPDYLMTDLDLIALVLEGLPEYITRLKGFTQKMIDLSKLGNDFVNVEESERDKGYGLFSLRSSRGKPPPTAEHVGKRARRKLHNDRYLHSGRVNEENVPIKDFRDVVLKRVMHRGCYKGSATGRRRSLAARVTAIYAKYWPKKLPADIPFATIPPIDSLLLSGLSVRQCLFQRVKGTWKSESLGHELKDRMDSQRTELDGDMAANPEYAASITNYLTSLTREFVTGSYLPGAELDSDEDLDSEDEE